MSTHPLLPPVDDQLRRRFVEHFRLAPAASPARMLGQLSAAFAQLPYENLTKIIKADQAGRPELARRGPEEVLADFVAAGGGGTCFALTATLLKLIRSLGLRAEPLLADRPYGQDTHCALAVWIDDRPHLVDPGYLIVEPTPLDLRGGQTGLTTPFNQLLLSPRHGGEKLELATVEPGRTRVRLTYKTQPADAGQFLRAWDASFGWDMMRYPLLTRVSGRQQLYLQGRRLQVRSHQAVRRQELSADQLTTCITHHFAIRPEVVAQALAILRRKKR